MLLSYKNFSGRAAANVIRVYQRTISPDHGIFKTATGTQRCRFYPSCSEYAIQSLRQYGLLKGSMSSLKRIVRCNPWNTGGYDPIH